MKINKITPLALMALALPRHTYAQVGATQTNLGEVNNFGEFISLIWNFGSQALLALAVFFIILGGLFYVGSAGDEQRIQQGRQMIMGAIVGVIVVIFSGTLMRTLHKTNENSSDYLSDIPNVINNASSLLTGTIGAFSVAMFAYAGLLTILANGDSEKIKKANRALKYAIYGLIIGLSAYAVVQLTINYLIT